MLTESQFREIADTLHCLAAELQDIVKELKKVNEGRTPKQVFTVRTPIGGFGGACGGVNNQHNFERSDHSGPSIA